MPSYTSTETFLQTCYTMMCLFCSVLQLSIKFKVLLIVFLAAAQLIGTFPLSPFISVFFCSHEDAYSWPGFLVNHL